MVNKELSKIEWQYFPRRSRIPDFLKNVISVFEDPANSSILSLKEFPEGSVQKKSNEVLRTISKSLSSYGIIVETGKKSDEKINMPVLFGKNGSMVMSYDVDAYDPINNFVIEVESGQAIANNRVIFDLFKCCVMVDVEYAVIAVRKSYWHNKNKKSTRTSDFDHSCKLLDTLYTSGRLSLPLKGVLIIGY